MTVKNQIKQVLEKWRFPILRETECDLIFRYQMNYVHVVVSSDENSDAISVLSVGIFNAGSEKEMMLGLKACNELNIRLIQVKLFIDSDADLNIAAEFFLKTQNDLEYLLKLSLDSVIDAKKQFIQEYEKLEAEAESSQEDEPE